MMLKSLTILTAALCLTSTAYAAGAAASEAPELPKIRVAYHPNLHGAAVVALGEAKNFFTDAGIEVEATRFTSGPPEISALVAGQIDIGFLGTGALPMVMEGKAVIIAYDVIGLAEEILVRPGSGIEKVEDLKGKRVITTLGTSGEMILRVALERAGLGLEDVTVETAAPENVVASFSTGQADAIALWQPLTNQVRKMVPGAVLIASGKELYPEHVFPIVWIANKDFAKERPDLVKRFLAAARHAIDYRSKNLDTTIQLVADYAKVPLDILEGQRDSAKFLLSAEFDELIKDGSSSKWLSGVEAIFKTMGRLDNPVPASDYTATHLFVDAPAEAASGPAAPREPKSSMTLIVLAVLAGVVVFIGAGMFLRHRKL